MTLPHPEIGENRSKNAPITGVRCFQFAQRQKAKVDVRHNFRRFNPKNKFSAKPTVVDGIRFDSKKEAAYYTSLKLRRHAGEVVAFLRQVPIHLPGGTKLVVDFLEFHAAGSVHVVDVKGQQTVAFKLKRREVEAIYPFEIELA